MFEEDKKNLFKLNKKTSSQIRHYQLIKMIGKGSYGKIYLAEDTKKNNLVALKIIDKTFLENLGKTEEAFIGTVDHPGYPDRGHPDPAFRCFYGQGYTGHRKQSDSGQ